VAGSDRLEGVEILRGIAAFSVMWFHLTCGNAAFLQSGSLLKASGAYGYLGVQLFFVISGFIIPYSLSLRNYRIETEGLGFLARRLVRIEPAYLVSAALMVVLQIISAVTPGTNALMPDRDILRLMTILALHFAYLASWFNVPWLSPVYWSLAIEFQYYIAMLFFAPLLISRRRASVYSFLIATVVLTLMVGDERTLFPYLPMFGLGFVRFLAIRRVLAGAELASWAFVFFGLCWFVRDSSQAVSAALAFCFLFLPLKRPVPMLSFLGVISYSLYLVHVPLGGRIINLASRLPHTIVVQLVALLCAVFISLLAAYCFWRLVERPSIKLSKSIGFRHISVVETATAAP
jgi:peptidoglycan/LPS O-acetylase OafA/YrhL